MSFKPCTILSGDRLSVLTPLISHVLSQVVEVVVLLLLPATLHLPCIESSPPPGLLFIALRSFQLDQGHQKKDQFRKTSDIRRQYGHGRFNKDTQLKMSKQTVYMSLLSQNQFYQVTVLRKLADISFVHFYRYFWF